MPSQSNDDIDLSSLYAMYGDEALPEILSSFLSEADQLMDSLEHELNNEDGCALAALAHQLKGLSAVISLSKMNKICVELEKAGSIYNWAQVRELVDKLKCQLASVKQVIKQHVK